LSSILPLLCGCFCPADAQIERAPNQPPAPLSIRYFIEQGSPGSGYRAGDDELARFALGAWERAAGGRLRFVPALREEAILQIRFVPAAFGQYGEMMPIRVNGRPGAAVFVRPDTDALGADIAEQTRLDSLLRDAVVYLTCLHEIGHAIGLSHTSEYQDVMYFFGFGGDIPKFFGRYRAQLETRTDIAAHSGLSAGDLAQLQAL
jgi:hypothetical protein